MEFPPPPSNNVLLFWASVTCLCIVFLRKAAPPIKSIGPDLKFHYEVYFETWLDFFYFSLSFAVITLTLSFVLESPFSAKSRKATKTRIIYVSSSGSINDKHRALLQR